MSPASVMAELKMNYDSELVAAIVELEQKIKYPPNSVGLARYSIFKGYKDNEKCGTCCYRGCNSNGYISKYEMHQGTTKALCYCNTTSDKIGEEFIKHRQACSSSLLSLYNNYKLLLELKQVD